MVRQKPKNNNKIEESNTPSNLNCSEDELCDQGIKSYLNGDYKEAIRFFNRAIKTNPNDELLWNNKGKETP